MKKSAIYTTLRNLLIEYFMIYHDNLAIILLSLSTFLVIQLSGTEIDSTIHHNSMWDIENKN